MIVDEELARTFRKKILQAIFGEDWRPDRPLDSIGAEMDVLLKGVDVSGYPRRAGQIQGLINALAIFDDARRELNALPGDHL